MGRSHVIHRAVFASCGISPAALHTYFIWALLCRPSAGDHERRCGRQKQGAGSFRAHGSRCLALLLVLEPIGYHPKRGVKAGTTSAIPETNNTRSTILRK